MTSTLDVKVPLTFKTPVSGESIIDGLKMVAELLNEKNRGSQLEFASKRGEWHMDGAYAKVGLYGSNKKHSTIIYIDSGATCSTFNPRRNYDSITLAHASDFWGHHAYETDYNPAAVEKHLKAVASELEDLLQ